MNTVTGDIWQISTPADAVVVPTNIGWRRRDNMGVLGKGLARDAARRFSWLAKSWGEYCRLTEEMTGPCAWRVDHKDCRYLIPFPTKPLNKEEPWLSWRSPASLELIERGLLDLQALAPAMAAYAKEHDEKVPVILVPALGCGLGELDEKDVLPLIKQHLTHPAFTYVRYGGKK